MSDTKPVTARFTEREIEAVEAYAEARDVSRSMAIRELVERGIRVSERPRGGRLHVAEHPWLDHAIRAVGSYGRLGAGLGLAAVGLWLFSAIGLLGATATALIAPVAAVAASLVGFTGLVYGALEILMHPREAPVRRHFNTPTAPVLGETVEFERGVGA